MEVRTVIDTHRRRLDSVLKEIQASESRSIALAATDIATTLKNGGKLFLAGNGGNAATAQHIAGEFVGRMDGEKKAYNAIALTCDGVVMTGIANDYTYEKVFSRQLQALARPDDILLALSISGDSPNIVQACTMAHSMDVRVVGVTGRNGYIGVLSRYPIYIDSTVPSVVQEAQLFVAHILCDSVFRILEAREIRESL